MTLKLQGSTSGHTAIDAPASAGSNTLVLPPNNGSAGQVLRNSSTPGTLEFGAPSKGVSSAQQFRLAADQAGSNSTGTVLTNWEEADTVYQAIGSNWSQSSGIFSCSATGIYLCMWNMTVNNINTQDAFDPNIQISTNSGSNYYTRSRTWSTGVGSGANSQSPNNQFIFDVADASTFRLRMRQSEDNAVASGSTIIGNSNSTLTHTLFIRLGDT